MKLTNGKNFIIHNIMMMMKKSGGYTYMIIVISIMVISIERLLTGWLLPLNYQLMQLVKKIFAPKEVKPHYGSFPDQNKNDNNDNDN